MKVPAEIQDFPYLLGFHIHNSTISEWNKGSSISAVKHAHMAVVLVTRCNMTSFPDELMQPMPTKLSLMIYSVTNLTTLPTNLKEVWEPIVCLYLDFSALEEIPESVFQLNIRSYSFVGNRIGHMPSFDAVNRNIPFIDMGMNPLQDLPPTVSA